MKFSLKFSFSAAHQYFRPSWSAEENRKYFGKCVAVHGHDYEMQFFFQTIANPSPQEIAELQEQIESLFSIWDHQQLPQADADFKDRIPTTEGIALTASEKLKQKLPKHFQIYKILVKEGPSISSEIQFHE